MIPTDKPFYYYFIWLFWGIIIYITFSSAINVSVSVGHDTRKVVSHLLPEGWGFFTRNPREALVDAYQVSAAGLKPLPLRNTSAANLVGISRKARFVGFELAKAIGYIPQQEWKHARGDLQKNIPAKPYPIELKEKLKYFPAGEYLFVQYKQMPWAWAKQSQESFRPYLVSRIKIL